MKGSGSILVVNLTDRSSQVVTLAPSVLERYLGGRGLAAYLLARYLPADTEPFSPANPLVFTIGPLQGTSAPFSSKIVLAAKSPLTGIYMYSLASGRMGHLLAGLGYCAVVILGASSEPLYLWIHDDQIEFRGATHIWGRPVGATNDHILDEIHDDGAGLAMIGPAGEALVRYAAVITELPRKRAFGRGGGGAVMGAKRLKAMAISGHGKADVADRDRFRAARKAAHAGVRAGAEWRDRRMTYGTTTSMPNLQEYGMLPTRNWSRGRFEGFDKIAPVACIDQWDVQNHPCAAYCPSPCAQVYRVTDGPYAGISTEGPDYETIYAFGANCGIDRLDAVIAMEDMADELGLDTISAGVTLSFIMECFERGLLTEDRAGGFSMRFGDHANAIKALGMIASRAGLGNLMAEGVKGCAAQIGQNSEAFAMHSKGLEFGGWGCRAAYGQALQFALSPRGGCHHDLGLPAKIEWGMDEAIEVEGKGELVLHTAPTRIVHDSAIQCSFSGLFYGQDVLAEAISAILGRDTTGASLRETGLRILNLERLINVREGVRRSWDRLPTRLLAEALPDGPRKGSTVPLERLKDDFYRAAGWNPRTGIPTLRTVQDLNLDQDLVVMAAFSRYLRG